MSPGLRGATVRLSAQISAATGLGLMVSLFARLITAHVLGPGSYGLLRIADVLAQYAGYADLGAKYVLSRQLSLLLGRGQQQQARETASLIYTWSVIATVGVLLILWGGFASGTTVQGLLTLPNVVALSLLIAANRINTYLANYVRGYGDFDAVGSQFFITALLPPLALIPGVYYLGVTGGLLSQLAVAIVVGLNLVRYAAKLGLFQLEWLADWRRLTELLKLSVLLQANTMSEAMFESLEMTLLVMFVPMEQVGLYGFAIGWMAATLSGLAGARMVIERAMLLEAGRAGDDTSPVRYHRYMQAPLVVNVLAAALALGTTYFAFDWVVATFLPAFVPSMPVARVLLLGQLLYAVTSFPRLYFNATGQLTNRLWFALFGLGLNVVLDLAFLFAGYGILGVAIGATISYGVYAAVLLPACTAQIEGSTMSGLSFMLRLLLAAGLAVLVLTALSEWHPGWANATSGARLEIWGRGVLLMLLKMAAYGATAVMTYFVAFWPYRPDREVLLLLRHARPGASPGRRASGLPR